MKYKVGDKVRVTIGNVSTYDYWGLEKVDNRTWYFNDSECEPYTPNQSIHITTDGMKTYGVMKCGNKVAKRVEAKCHEDDEFSFETGAKIVMDRMFDDENEKKIENDSTINVGDKVKIIDGGKAYANYAEWVMQNCPEKAVYYKYNANVTNGTEGVVIKIAPHLSSDRMLYYIENDDGCYLVNVEGLEKVID